MSLGVCIATNQMRDGLFYIVKDVAYVRVRRTINLFIFIYFLMLRFRTTSAYGIIFRALTYGLPVVINCLYHPISIICSSETGKTQKSENVIWTMSSGISSQPIKQCNVFFSKSGLCSVCYLSNIPFLFVPRNQERIRNPKCEWVCSLNQSNARKLFSNWDGVSSFK
jgi:hypothetical protein